MCQRLRSLSFMKPLELLVQSFEPCNMSHCCMTLRHIAWLETLHRKLYKLFDILPLWGRCSSLSFLFIFLLSYCQKMLEVERSCVLWLVSFVPSWQMTTHDNSIQLFCRLSASPSKPQGQGPPFFSLHAWFHVTSCDQAWYCSTCLIRLVSVHLYFTVFTLLCSTKIEDKWR